MFALMIAWSMTAKIPKVALVTGGSRGVGAAAAKGFAERGIDVAVTYRNKTARAEKVAAEVESLGRRALLLQADLTSEQEMTAALNKVRATFGKLDFLVLNASGGLEKGKAPDYAMQLNRDAQVMTAELALPLMPEGGRIVFVTSHLAHFYREKPVFSAYESVAQSKRAGEDALRERSAAFDKLGVSLVVVSGDLIEGTITPKLLERASPGLIETRREQAGTLPSVEDFAQEIVNAALSETLANGATVFVGQIE